MDKPLVKPTFEDCDPEVFWFVSTFRTGPPANLDFCADASFEFNARELCATAKGVLLCDAEASSVPNTLGIAVPDTLGIAVPDKLGTAAPDFEPELLCDAEASPAPDTRGIAFPDFEPLDF